MPPERDPAARLAVATGATALLLLGTAVLAPAGGFPVRAALAAGGLLLLGVAQAVAAIAASRRPSRGRAAAVALLALGAVATILMTPFAAMALAALAEHAWTGF